jgi:hypothetical protein
MFRQQPNFRGDDSLMHAMLSNVAMSKAVGYSAATRKASVAPVKCQVLRRNKDTDFWLTAHRARMASVNVLAVFRCYWS